MTDARQAGSDADRDRRHDFDFLHGEWRTDHRRLKQRLTGCQEWEEFSTPLRCRPVLGGFGNIDEAEFSAQGYHTMSLRLYDRATRTWSIFWITSRSSAIDPGVTGGFSGDGEGTFLGEDTHEGTPVRVRYLWSRITATTARWDQAFSLDGQAWETNWITDLTRI